MSQVWARCPAEHHKVLVINLPSRSTALTCRHTETFPVHLYYTQLRLKYQLEFRFSQKFLQSQRVYFKLLYASSAIHFQQLFIHIFFIGSDPNVRPDGYAQITTQKDFDAF